MDTHHVMLDLLLIAHEVVWILQKHLNPSFLQQSMQRTRPPVELVNVCVCPYWHLSFLAEVCTVNSLWSGTPHSAGNQECPPLKWGLNFLIWIRTKSGCDSMVRLLLLNPEGRFQFPPFQEDSFLILVVRLVTDSFSKLGTPTLDLLSFSFLYNITWSSVNTHPTPVTPHQDAGPGPPPTTYVHSTLILILTQDLNIWVQVPERASEYILKR